MKYENLEIWKRSRVLAINVYKRSSSFKDFGFKDQITRSALSVPSNIAEGFEKHYEKEKARILAISKGSLGEFKTQVEIGVEVGFIERYEGAAWMNEAEEISKMIGRLIIKINN